MKRLVYDELDDTTREHWDRWFDVLRDPDAQQARHRLERVNGGRCCLGHACHMFAEAGLLTRKVDSNSLTTSVSYGRSGDGFALVVLPLTAMRLLGGVTEHCYFCTPVGLNSYFPHRYPEARALAYSAADLNDTFKLTLPEIATVLEGELQKGNITANGDIIYEAA